MLDDTIKHSSNCANKHLILSKVQSLPYVNLADEFLLRRKLQLFHSVEHRFCNTYHQLDVVSACVSASCEPR